MSFIASFIIIFIFSHFFPYWYDEHIFFRFGWKYYFFADKYFYDILQYSKLSYHPPFHILLHILIAKILYPLNLYNYNVLRLLSIILSCSAIRLLCIDSFKNNKMPLFIFILLLYPHVIFTYYWQVGPYALSFFLSTVYFIHLKELIRKNESKFDWTLLLSAIALSYTHYFGTAMVLIVGLVMLVKSYVHKDKCIKNLLIIHFTAFVMFLPWLILIWKKIFENKLLDGIEFAVQKTVEPEKFHFYATYANDHVQSLIIILIIIGLSFLKRTKNRDQRRENWWIVAFFGLWALIEFKSQISTPLYRCQYTMIFFPFFVWVFNEQIVNIFRTKQMRYLFYIFFIVQQAHHALPQFILNKEESLFGFYEKSTQMIKDDIKSTNSKSSPIVYHASMTSIDLEPYGIKNAIQWEAQACKTSNQITRKNDYLLFPYQNCSKETLNESFSDWDILINLPGTLLLRKK